MDQESRFSLTRLPIYSIICLKLFGKSLETFNNFDEGVIKIDNFLNSNPNEFIVSIPYFETSIFKTLEKMKVI